LKGWLVSMLDAQGISKFDVMGQGNGAWLALELLLSDSARVRRLGLVNLPLRKEKQGLRLPWGNDWTRTRVQRWVGSPELSETSRQISEPLWAEMFVQSPPKRSPEFPESEFHGKLSGYGDALRGFAGEVMLLWGAKDAAYDEQPAREFAGGRSSIAFEESSRYPMWDEPEKYKKVVTEFFAD
jgi:pimeloyl-ACP methyl ester carboxylesterase